MTINFTIPGIIAEKSSYTRSILNAGTTVRVLVYQRVGTLADPSVDTYITENTYVVSSGGNLSPCITDDNGNKTSDTGTEIIIRPGVYDFYAITPASKVTRASGATVSVTNGIDYATSLTENITIGTSSTSQTVILTTLDRKCAQLVFNIDRGTEAVTSVIIDELSLAELAISPITSNLKEDLPAATDNSGTISLGSSAFTTDATDVWKASGSVVVLPKSNATYTLTLTARFNGSSSARTMTVTVPTIAFEKGKQYTYTLQLYGDRFAIALTSVSSDSWINPTSMNADGVGDGTLKNLSMNASGVIETANCYIVNSPNQDYKFKATVMGNGATTPSSTCGDQIAPAIVPTALSPDSAFVIWETGSKGDVIQAGSLKLLSNGYVTFKTANNSTNGNAVIGVTDSNRRLLWSWHIWKTGYTPDKSDANTYDIYTTRTIDAVTYTGYNSIPTRSFKMMKYNLGTTATAANYTSDGVPGELGLYYQWGRKDPFVGATDWTTSTSYGSIRIITTNASGYGWYDGSDADATAKVNTEVASNASGSISYAIEHPTHFIKASSANVGWLSATNHAGQRDNLWGNPNISDKAPNPEAGSKSIYDPCPPGWMVVRTDGYTGFTATGINASATNDFLVSGSYNNGWNFYNDGTTSGTTYYWPALGYRALSIGSLGGIGTVGYYWTSSPYNSNDVHAMVLNFSEGRVEPMNLDGVRSGGTPIRCAQEE